MTGSRVRTVRSASVRPVLLAAVLACGLTLTGCGDGLRDLVPGSVDTTENASPVAEVPTGSASGSRSPAAARPALQVLDGPFGTGSYSHLALTVTAAEVSDLAPDDWGTPGATPADPDARNLYVTLEIVNEDPNDRIVFDDANLSLVGADGVDGVGGADATDGGAAVKAVRVDRGTDFTPYVDRQDTVVRTYGFPLGRAVDPADLSLRYAHGSVPVTVPLLGAGAADPYPLPVRPPATLSFVGSLTKSCPVTWKVTVDKASLALDLPADLRDSSGAMVSNRAPEGTRWLVLETAVSAGRVSGPASCAAMSQGNLNVDSFRLVVDGRPVAPDVAPNTILTARRTESVRLIWQVGTGTTDVALRGLGQQGTKAEKPFTLPAMPAVAGE